MGLNRVVREIKENAKKEAERIIREGKDEAENILRQAEEGVKKRLKEIKEDAENRKKQTELRSRTLTKIRTKELALGMKKEAVERVYQEFLAFLKNMKGREKERTFRSMIRLARKQIGEPETIYVRKEDSAFAKKIFREFQIKTKDIEGGFILESKDGKEMVDFSFEAILEMLKGKTLKSVSRVLFGG